MTTIARGVITVQDDELVVLTVVWRWKIGVR